MGVSLSAVSPTRQRWLDAARGIAMLLVVYNHVCMGLWTASIPFWPHPYGPIYLLIRALMLPVLLLAAGALLERSLQPGLLLFMRKRALRLLAPYLLWSIILAAIYWLCGGWMNVPARNSDLHAILLKGGSGPLLFLLWLFVSQLAYALLRAAGLKPAWLIVPAAAAVALVRPVSILADLYATPPGMFLMLVVGACTEPWLRKLAQARTRDRWVSGLVVVSVLVAVALLAAPWPRWDPSARAALGIVGGIGGAIIAIAIAPTVPGALLALPGRYSLAILLVHTVLTAGTRIFLVRVAHTTDMTVHLLVGTLAGVIGPIMISRLAEAWGMGWLMDRRRQREDPGCGRIFSSSCATPPVS